ncbi:hypothetical protein AM588_10007623 [Phytophthora nicotianae]|uniref:Uncharacterized protein n=1 Tax=Phytophthora nicotianae TaxID=4792 RepID=A0A0W8D8S3_PHYNI|nr:hypothetical protein AM588_10007623 [Phytophthora nicotianae]
MLTPCSNPRKWVVISLSEDQHSNNIFTAVNFSRISSVINTRSWTPGEHFLQALEVNQSVMSRQLEEFHAHQWAAIKMLQANQESLNEQLKEIRSMIVDLNEMLIVREVITTMKAGILCAIVLSGFIILFYLLRLLFRCVSKCKERADLREWFWRMENHESSSDDQGKKDGNMAAGALRVNRKAQFGSSWDDSAIERKTLVSDMVGEGPHKFRRHRAKRASQPAMALKRSRK